MTFSTWSQTAASNTSVGGISTDGTVTLVKQIDNMFRGMMAELAVARDDGTIGATAERGYLNGLALSNNAGDATNDIDIAAGECAALDSPYWRMALASALTKRLDANWTVGTNQGGLDTGAIANTTYHVWLIARSDTGVVDALFSASATSPTMPASYDRKRRIGSIIRESGAIVGFYQIGDTFRRFLPASASTTLTTFAATLTNCKVPAGIIVQPILTFAIDAAVSSSGIFNIGSAQDANIIVPAIGTFSNASGGTFIRSILSSGFFTNASGQLYLSLTVTGTLTTANVSSIGWIDGRGRT